MVRRRLARNLERWMDFVPSGVELNPLQEVVASDLLDEAQLADLIGADSDADDLIRHRQVPRIRPILVALAARAAGADSVDSDLLHVAEMLHLALAVHDTALGREGGRRRRVARKLVRRGVGWLGGNHLTLRAVEITRHVSPDVLGELIDTLREFADGQALAAGLQAGDAPDFEDWLDHADAHTGALFAFCCRAGGHLGGADSRVLSALGRYGRHTGRLWHIAEDLSVLKFQQALVMSRALAGRPMLPVVVAGASDPEIPKAWGQLVANPDAEAVDAFVAALPPSALGAAKEQMLREAWSARRALRGLPDTPYRQALERLVTSLVNATRARPAEPTDG